MMGFLEFMLCVVGVWGLFMFLVFFHDHVALWLMGPSVKYFFPLASMVADLIIYDKDEWQYTHGVFIHSKLGISVHAHSKTSLAVEMNNNQINPNMLERLVMWRAVQWRLRTDTGNLVAKRLRELA